MAVRTWERTAPELPVVSRRKKRPTGERWGPWPTGGHREGPVTWGSSGETSFTFLGSVRRET